MCDKRVPDRLKPKICQAVIRPVALHVTECWPERSRAPEIMETKVLLLTAGITRLDGVRNSDIRRKFGMVPINVKMRENGLRYGHVLLAEDDTVKSAYSLKFLAMM